MLYCGFALGIFIVGRTLIINMLESNGLAKNGMPVINRANCRGATQNALPKYRG